MPIQAVSWMYAVSQKNGVNRKRTVAYIRERTSVDWDTAHSSYFLAKVLDRYQRLPCTATWKIPWRHPCHQFQPWTNRLVVPKTWATGDSLSLPVLRCQSPLTPSSSTSCCADLIHSSPVATKCLNIDTRTSNGVVKGILLRTPRRGDMSNWELTRKSMSCM